MAEAGTAQAPWPITTVVSCLPVLVLVTGTALAHMLRADTEAAGTPGSRTGPPVEAVLYHHSAIAEVAVLEIPHEQWGEASPPWSR